MSEIVKPRMLTKVQIEILRGELGHDDAYNLLCDMAIKSLTLTPPKEKAK